MFLFSEKFKLLPLLFLGITMPEGLTDRSTCHKCHKNDKKRKKLSKCGRCHAITYCGQECQVEDWPRHKDNCIPVMVTEIEGKGRGLVAAKDIKMGELIFNDKVIMNVDLPYSEVFGTVPEGKIIAINEEFEKLSDVEKSQFLYLENNGERYGKLDSTDRSFCEKASTYIHNSLIEQCEKLFLNIALLNHSCDPNAEKSSLSEDSDQESKELYELRAIKNISKGEEITIFYLCSGSVLAPHSLIRYNLLSRFDGLDCKCKVCTGERPNQDDIKEELRMLMKPPMVTNTLRQKNLYRMTIADWKRKVLDSEKAVELLEELYYGSTFGKAANIISFASYAQLGKSSKKGAAPASALFFSHLKWKILC